MRAKGTGARSSTAKSRSSASRGRGTKAKSSAKRSTVRSKATRSQSGQVTIDHDEIRQWVESRGGHPATVTGTERDFETAGLLRIDFPGYSGEGTLEPLEWDDFFEKFEEANLAFLYDPDKGSKFNKFIARGNKRF